MKTYRYVKLDPTGNITCLVLDPATPGDAEILTRELLKQCEQVAYLENASVPGAVAAIRLMGGEFCGNAALASAAWLVRDELENGGELSFLLQVSGTADPVPCRIRRTEDTYEGTAEMPPVREVRKETFEGIPFTLVRTDGIVHLIHEGNAMRREAAEALLKRIADRLPDDAAGFLQWDRKTQLMQPLVYVRGSGSLVWENGCGSGSAAVGAVEALRNGDGTHRIPVEQPGGVICVTAVAEKGAVLSVSITGQVRLGEESVIEIP